MKEYQYKDIKSSEQDDSCFSIDEDEPTLLPRQFRWYNPFQNIAYAYSTTPAHDLFEICKTRFAAYFCFRKGPNGLRAIVLCIVLLFVMIFISSLLSHNGTKEKNAWKNRNQIGNNVAERPSVLPYVDRNLSPLLYKITLDIDTDTGTVFGEGSVDLLFEKTARCAKLNAIPPLTVKKASIIIEEREKNVDITHDYTHSTVRFCWSGVVTSGKVTLKMEWTAHSIRHGEEGASSDRVGLLARSSSLIDPEEMFFHDTQYNNWTYITAFSSIDAGASSVIPCIDHVSAAAFLELSMILPFYYTTLCGYTPVYGPLEWVTTKNGGGRLRTSFTKTPFPLSPGSWAFGASTFSQAFPARAPNGLNVKVFSVNAARAQYAADAAYEAIRILEAYFGIAYPLYGLHIAGLQNIPYHGVGGAGVVGVRESDLLYDVQIEGSFRMEMAILRSVSHAAAHVWWRGTVTIPGLARYCEYIVMASDNSISNNLLTSQETWDFFYVDETMVALSSEDILVVNNNNNSPRRIQDADRMRLIRGAARFHSLVSLLLEPKNNFTEYITTFYENFNEETTVFNTSIFWSFFPTPFTKLAEALSTESHFLYIKKNGAPVLHIGATTIHNINNNKNTDFIPLTISNIDTLAITYTLIDVLDPVGKTIQPENIKSIILNHRNTTFIPVNYDKSRFLLLFNPGRSGYYRIQYNNTESLPSQKNIINYWPPRDQAGILDDTWALLFLLTTETSYHTITNTLELTEALMDAQILSYPVWRAIEKATRTLKRKIGHSRDLVEMLVAWIAPFTIRMLNNEDWHLENSSFSDGITTTHQESASISVRATRAIVLEMAVRLRVPVIIKQCADLFEKATRNYTTTLSIKIHPDLQSAIFAGAAAVDRSGTTDTLWSLSTQCCTYNITHTIKSIALRALAYSPNNTKQLLKHVFLGDDIDHDDLVEIARILGDDADNRHAFWKFFKTHHKDAFHNLLKHDKGLVFDIVYHGLRGFQTKKYKKEIELFVSSHRGKIHPVIADALEIILYSIEKNIKWKANCLENVSDWLKRRE